MREREAMNLPALGVAIAGPLAGIGIWYAVDRWTGHLGLALGLAAGVIYVSARLTRALAAATSLGEEIGAISIMLVVVGVPYAALVLIGVPAIVALPVGIILGPPFDPGCRTPHQPDRRERTAETIDQGAGGTDRCAR